MILIKDAKFPLILVKKEGKGTDMTKKIITCVIRATLKAEIWFSEDVEMFVAYVPTLDIFSQGKTVTKARLALEDAVNSFLIVKHDLITRDRSD